MQVSDMQNNIKDSEYQSQKREIPVIRLLPNWITGLINPDCNPFCLIGLDFQPILRSEFGLPTINLHRIWIGLTNQKMD